MLSRPFFRRLRLKRLSCFIFIKFYEENLRLTNDAKKSSGSMLVHVVEIAILATMIALVRSSEELEKCYRSQRFVKYFNRYIVTV